MAASFGQRIATLLDEKGMKQAELADAAGFSQASVSLYIHNKRQPNLQSLQAMAKALDVPVSTLLGDDEITEEQLAEAVYAVANNAKRLTAAQRNDLLVALGGGKRN